MKILIYEDWEHFVPAGKGLAKGLSQNGHRVFQMGHINSLTKLEEKVDLILHFDVPNNHKDILDAFKNMQPDCKIVGFAGPYKQEYSDYRDYIDMWFSLSTNFSKYRKEFKKNGIKQRDCPFAVDEDQFYPMDIKKLFDISFIGVFGLAGHGDRGEEHYLFPLLYDESLTRFIGGFEFVGRKWPKVYYKNLNKIYNATKVNLNFHYPIQKEENRIDFNTRVFDIPASGAFMLCDHEYMKTYFGEDILVGNEENWTELVNYYVNNDSEREEEALKLHKIVMSKHTFKQRTKELLGEIYNDIEL